MTKIKAKNQKSGGYSSGGATRSAAVVRRLKMYKCHPKRDRKGKIKKSQDFQSKDLPCTRIQPDRRYFGNTRVISQKDLQIFREKMQYRMSNRMSRNFDSKKIESKNKSKVTSAMKAICEVVKSQQFEDVPVRSDFYGKLN